MNKASNEIKVNEKEKVMFPEIVVRGTKDKPYYEIKYYDVTDKQWHLGYGSYNLEYVMQWKEECLEVVEGSITNDLCEKIKEKLEEEQKLAEEDKCRYVPGNVNVTQYCKAVGYANAMSVAIDIVNEVEGETSIAEDITTTDLSISLPKVAFDRMIARMESESERDIYEEESLFINVRDAARIVREIAGEYKHGHYGCNWNGQHEKCKNCGLRGECSHCNTEWFAEYSNSEIPNMSENLTSSDEYCEWKLDGVYLHCQHKTDLIITCLEDEKYRYNFCPCCGKEIKVVE